MVIECVMGLYRKFMIIRYSIERNCTEDERKKLTTLLSTLIEGANNIVFLGKLKTEIEMK